MMPQRIGRYEIVEELGRGAMGVVYKATDPTIGRMVALKTTRVDAHTVDPAELMRRSKNEARAAGALNHPHIVTIHDAGDDNGVFYIAMEYIEGTTLQHLQATRDLTVDQIIDVAGQICAGLDYAHEHGVVHRDIKPSNIMVNRAGLVKITDFGIAKADSGLTTAGKVMGTPDYMSPEQVKGAPLDGRSDLFSLGVVLYELVTGERPFTGQNITTLIYKIVNEMPIPPFELDASVHPGLSAVITKALAKSPEERYQTGAELMRELRDYKNVALRAADTVPLVLSYGPGVTTTVLPGAGQAGAAVMPAREATAIPATADITSEVDVAPAATPAPGPPRHTAPAAAAKPAPVAKPAAPAPPAAKTLSFVVWIIAIGLLVLGAVAATLGYLHRQQRALAAARQQAETAAKAANVPSPAASVLPTPATGDQAEAAAEIAKPAAKITSGELSITSAPAGAAVQIDGRGQQNWKTPFVAARLKPGKHNLLFSKDGYTAEWRAVDVVAGKTVAVSARLAPNAAIVNIASDPPGARIIVDGAESGKLTPAQIMMPPGQHNIGLAKFGFKPEQLVADVKMGQKLDMAATLKPGRPVDERKASALKRFLAQTPDKGAVVIRTQPPGARIAIEGVAIRRQTPMRLPAPPGRYTITISLDGYRPITRTIDVEAGKMVQLDEFLQPQ